LIRAYDRYWPLLVHVLDGTATPAELDAWLSKLEGFLARGEKNLTLCIGQNMKMWEPALLRRCANWMREHQGTIRERSLGFAFVLPSPVARGLLKALLWLQSLPQAHTVTSTVPEALVWLRPRALAAGFLLPTDEDIQRLVLRG
jgi:hypothetical protein